MTCWLLGPTTSDPWFFCAITFKPKAYHKYSPKEQVFARAKASSEPACSRITNDAKGASAAAGAKGETERGCEITDSGTGKWGQIFAQLSREVELCCLRFHSWYFFT